MNLLGRIGGHLLDALVPLPCPLCDEVGEASAHNLFCKKCLKQMPSFVPPLCSDCGGTLDTVLDCCTSCASQPRRPWENAFALFPHREPIKDLIHQLKYRNRPDIARAFAALATEKVKEITPRPDLIVPVPMHWFRRLRRGYNHAALIAVYLAKYTEIPYGNILYRKGLSRHQMGLQRRDRQKNLNKDAFGLHGKTSLSCKHILLVDDVLTTGSTLAAVTQRLLDADAREVTVLVISRR